MVVEFLDELWLEYVYIPSIAPMGCGFFREVWPYLKKNGNAGRARSEKCWRPRVVQGRVHEERASPKLS